MLFKNLETLTRNYIETLPWLQFWWVSSIDWSLYCALHAVRVGRGGDSGGGEREGGLNPDISGFARYFVYFVLAFLRIL